MNRLTKLVGYIVIILLSFTLMSACQTVSDGSKTSVSEDNLDKVDLPIDSTVDTTSSDSQFVSDAAETTQRFFPNTDLLRVGDKITVEVYGFDSLSDVFIVTQNGDINFPLLGTLNVVGLTSLELQSLLTQRYGDRYLQNPNINITVDPKVLGSITVDGAVKAPGIFPISDFVTVGTAVVMAKGLNDDAIRNELFVIRVVNDERIIYTVDLNAIQTQGAPDPAIIPGDYIFVRNDANKDRYNELLRSLPLVNMLSIITGMR